LCGQDFTACHNSPKFDPIETVWNICHLYSAFHCQNIELLVANFVIAEFCFCYTEKLFPSGTASVASTSLAHSDAGMKRILHLVILLHYLI